MSGAPALTCPECGKNIRKERCLFRTRRRWPLALSGSLLVVFGVASAAAPLLHNNRWIAYAPTLLLVKFYPPAGQEYVSLSPLVMHPVIEELKTRASRPSFSRREWRALIEHTRMFEIKPQPIPQDGKILIIDKFRMIRIGLERQDGGRLLFVDMRMPYELLGLAEIQAVPRVPEPRQLSAGSLYPEMCGVGAQLREDLARDQFVGVVDERTKTVTFDVVLCLAPDNFWRTRTANDTTGMVYTGPVTIPIPSDH